MARCIPQHMVDRSEHRGRDGADGFLRSTVGTQAFEFRPVVAVLLSRGCPGALHKDGLEPGHPFAQTRGFPFAGALVLAWTHPGPCEQELRELAANTRDRAVVRRLLGIAILLDGWSRGEAATASGMGRQTLCDWVHRYNVSDVAGLETGKRSGRPPAMSDAQMAELKALVIKGPDPDKDGVVRWRCVDLRAAIARLYLVQVDQRTVVKWLRKFNLTRLQPRPYHPKKDAEAQETFKNSFAVLVIEALPTSAAGKPLEIWFQDEARVGRRDGSLPVGAARLSASCDKGQSSGFGRLVCRDLPGSAGRGRYHYVRRQQRAERVNDFDPAFGLI
jgi:transposase